MLATAPVDAVVLLVLDDWSLLATEPVEDAVLEVEPLALPVEAKPLFDPVWLSELLELVDGDEAVLLLLDDWSFEATVLLVLLVLGAELCAVLFVLDDWSLLAIDPVEEAVLEVEPLVLPVEAKPLVEPVWLKELLEVEDGEEEDATLALLVVPLF